MEWIAGALALLLVLFIALYRKSLNESRTLTNYALLLLLDDGVYAVQRKGLADLVRSLDAKNVGELGGLVNLLLVRLVERLGHTLLGVAGLLWKLKTTPTDVTVLR